ncbi:MAG TPA: ATP-dependent Clp protease ATP-binding subunit ClpX [Myxococcota bacterium]|nr:ATP-dependent Clp protease ATP-binding subunit ClpX [Myxococcota bacterium]
MSKKYNNVVLHCSFCKKSQNDVKKLVAGPSVYVCDECIKLCNKIIEEDRAAKEFEGEAIKLPTPHAIKEFLDLYVIAQDDAKKVLAVSVYNHYKRINAQGHRSDVQIQKSNILLLGPTGTGKTLLAQSLARLLQVPFCVVDATSLTEAGYVGEDSESILQNLLTAADNNVQKASRGIVYLDEVDKIAKKGGTLNSSRDVSGEGVQQSLLKLIEGSIVAVSPRGAKKYGQPEQVVHIDTKDILFICGGAFVGLEQILARKSGKKTLGFNASAESPRELGSQLVEAEPEDIINYGFIPEFVGRLPIIASLHDIDEKGLITILSEPKNALVKQYQKLFALEGVELNFSEDALKEVARIAMKRKTGARGLRSVLEQAMLDIMYSVPFLEGVERCTITKEVVDGTGEPELTFRKRQQMA